MTAFTSPKSMKAVFVARKEANAIKVTHFPASRDGNPYTRLLIDAVRRAGVDACGRPNSFQRNPWKALRWAFNEEIVHWHWLDGHYSGRTIIRFLARSVLFALTLFLIRMTGTRMVMTVHNLVPHEHRFRALHLLINRTFGLLMHRLIVHNRAAADIVECSFGARRKVSVVEHIDYGPILPEEVLNKSTAKENLGWDTAQCHVLFFGQIRAYKGVDVLLRSVPYLSDDVTIVIAGRPSGIKEVHKLQALAAMHTNVKLRLEHVPGPELSQLLWASDIAVFPYADSLASGAGHLALAHGLPIVAPRTPAFQEFVELKLAVECLDPKCPQSLADAIVAAQRVDAHHWGEQCAMYRARCSCPVVGPKLRVIYEEVLGR